MRDRRVQSPNFLSRIIILTVYFFAFLSGKTLYTRAKRDRRVHTCICLSRFFSFSVFSRIGATEDLHPPPILFGVSQDTPKSLCGFFLTGEYA